MTDNDNQLILAALTRIEQRLDSISHDIQQAKTSQQWEKKREKKILAKVKHPKAAA
jgi:hypothetical protein